MKTPLLLLIPLLVACKTTNGALPSRVGFGVGGGNIDKTAGNPDVAEFEMRTVGAWTEWDLLPIGPAPKPLSYYEREVLDGLEDPEELIEAVEAVEASIVSSLTAVQAAIVSAIQESGRGRGPREDAEEPVAPAAGGTGLPWSTGEPLLDALILLLMGAGGLEGGKRAVPVVGKGVRRMRGR